MPTAARLFAALAFFAVAFFAAETYKPGLAGQVSWGWFSLIAATIGALCGWRVMGSEAGDGMVHAMSAGLRTATLIVMSTLLLFAVLEMLRRTLRNRYDGVFDALLGVFDLFVFYGRALMQPEPLIVLLAGGLLGGALTEWAARRWS